MLKLFISQPMKDKTDEEIEVVRFVKGWEKARGCRIENECASAYGIEVIEYLTE